jgi:thiamine biosynthesis protein ThiS
VQAERRLRVVVNGSATELPQGATVSDLLRILDIRATMVAVEQNLEIVKREDYGSRKISEGDRFEIVHFVGGG